jgi:pyruvate/2-oxoglutarate dehydrogenase complex dihydrolipoamide dehydrogenase (E3) component
LVAASGADVREPIYDVFVIGAGQAGLPLAHALAKAGRRVALAERKDLGGSCVNFGCTPTKAVIASARVAHMARGGALYGLRIPHVEVDFPAVLDRARSLVMQSRASLRRDLSRSDNPRLITGHARLSGRDGQAFRLRVGNRSFLARQVVLDTGTRTLLPRVPGLDRVAFLHAGNWLERPELPEHVIFLGAGYIALEMGQFYKRMGSQVTIVERAHSPLSREDEDVTSALQAALESESVAFRLGTRVTRVVGRGKTVTLETEGGGRISGSHLFVATGRRPNTDHLGLASVGLRRGPHGTIPVNERLRTSVPGLWAAGDIRGGPMFTHTAWDDFRILESQMLGDRSRTTRRIVPYAVYTDPELGRVGLTEQEALQAGKRIRVGRFSMRANGKAREIGETGGFVKVVVEAKTDRILGATVLSAAGAELVHVFVELMNANAPWTVLRDAVHVHPTLAEAAQSAVLALD